MAQNARFDPIPLMSWAAEYGPLPDSYVALDLETTGVDPYTDRILQFGWCLVKDRVPILTADLLVDWSWSLSSVELSDFSRRLERTRARMEEKNKSYPWTLELLRTRGKHPRDVATRLTKLFEATPAVAAHYGMNLDFPVLGRFMSQNGGVFEPAVVGGMIDTGLLTKACYLSLSPAVGEDPVGYYRRLTDARTGVKHGLEACVDLFDLKDVGATKKDQHLAGFDSWVVHLVYERLRSYTLTQETTHVQK